jgi:hypothetical protein
MDRRPQCSALSLNASQALLLTAPGPGCARPAPANGQADVRFVIHRSSRRQRRQPRVQGIAMMKFGHSRGFGYGFAMKGGFSW